MLLLVLRIQKYIDEYNEEVIDGYLKGLIGEKKREDFKSLTKPMFENLSSSILNDVKLTMKSVEDSVKSEKKDGW